MAEFYNYKVFFCIKCEQKIKSTRISKVKEEYLEEDRTDLSNYFFHDGIVECVSAGYGSSHDADIFYVGICDSCITDSIEKGLLLYKGNYLFGNHPYSEKVRKKAEERFLSGYKRKLRSENINKLNIGDEDSEG